MADGQPDHDDLCAAVRQFLATGRDEPLSPGEEERLANHLAECEPCRRMRDEHRAVWDLLGRAALPPPVTSDARFLAAVRERVRRSAIVRRSAVLVAAASIAAAVGIAWFFPGTTDEQAIIADAAVLQDFRAESQAAEDAGAIGRELMALLEQTAPAAQDATDDGDELEKIIEQLDEAGARG